MKLFDPRAALVKIQNQAPAPATSATSATQTSPNAAYVASVAEVAAAQDKDLKANIMPGSAIRADCKHGYAINGDPKTSTGKIVSLDAWRQLSAWEKHGPNGR